METITNRALISRLYSSANQHLKVAKVDIENWSQWYNTVQEMTIPEKMVYVIVTLNKAVTHGGFAEFYQSSFGIFAPEIIHALNEVKAEATAEIVHSTLLVINPTGLLDEAYKEHVFNFQLSEHQRLQLFSQDIRYDQLEGIENLEDLLGDYLQKIIV